MGAVAERGNGEGDLVGHIKHLVAEIIDNADKLSAIVSHGGVLHGEGIAVAERLAGYAGDKANNVDVLKVYVIEIRKIVRLEPHILVGLARKLIEKAEVYLDLEYGILGLGNGDIVRPRNVQLTAEKTRDDLQNLIRLEVCYDGADVHITGDKRLYNGDELIDVELV